ncbi:protein ENHANCED DISEASE RESISTANCE 2-like isoform X1 [Zingiber officinale]|uniref:protein ENHANCED DISEASE RESISTANCE 2-like isoform X1 n=1 Tax=Zingiber officinale TaxID=94328 RepID=UPI001C4B67AA|nr:protein ENHANCED DISEASE RESISTANCE 2-like isoform X1 [Zingiber officinale]
MEEEKATQAAVAAEALSDKEGHGSDCSPLVSGSGREIHYGGWVYHLGVNTVGHEYCHLRYLVLRGAYIVMYKRDPEEHPGMKPIRKGAISHTLKVEEVGRCNINHGELYVLRFYNRLEQRKLGEIACASAGESHKWMEAFEQAKQQAEYNLLKGSTRQRFNMDGEFNLEGHRPRVRRYAKGLKKLIKIGKGPEMLIRQSSGLGSNARRGAYFEGDIGDVIEMHDWKCVRTVDGVRIFEDVSNSKDAKRLLLKSVSIIEANADTVFEVVLNLDRHKRYEWDTLTGDLELLDSVNGHNDVVYGTYEPTHLNWWHSKRDFIFSRQWFRGQDGSYTILQLPASDKRRPPKSGYRRTKINPSTWEIRRLKTSNFSTEKCLVTHMLEVQYYSWGGWWRKQFSNFDKTIPYALLCQVTGLKEYFGANPSLTIDTSLTIVEPKVSDASTAETEFKDSEMADEFFDATASSDSLDDEDSDDEIEISKGAGNLKLKNVSWAILALRGSKGLLERSELDANCPSITIDPRQFHGSMVQGKAQTDTNCWSSPNGHGFMIRGKNYLKDYSKIVGGDPLLKLIAVDWFKADNNSIDKVALHPKSLVQSKAGKALPFILIVNLEIPSKPNYSLVLYYAAEKPLSKHSLLGRFVDGTDMFRDSRFKLIPSIVEGYWMVKRAVGTKACLLGKAVTCKYLRQDNFLEIDVEIGSSSVARSIISLVIGYITSIVVDLAILIEAKEENELPEYILGTVRLNQVRLESAVPYWGES